MIWYAQQSIVAIDHVSAGTTDDNLQAIVNALTPDLLIMGFELTWPQQGSSCLQIEQLESSANLLIDITCNNSMLWTEIKLYE